MRAALQRPEQLRVMAPGTRLHPHIRGRGAGTPREGNGHAGDGGAAFHGDGFEGLAVHVGPGGRRRVQVQVAWSHSSHREGAVLGRGGGGLLSLNGQLDPRHAFAIHVQDLAGDRRGCSIRPIDRDKRTGHHRQQEQEGESFHRRSPKMTETSTRRKSEPGAASWPRPPHPAGASQAQHQATIPDRWTSIPYEHILLYSHVKQNLSTLRP